MLLNIYPRFEQRTCVKPQSCQQRPTVKTVSKLYNGRVIVGKLIPVLHLYLLCRLVPTTHNINPLNSRKEARCVTSFNFANMTVSKDALHRYISRRNCDAYFGKSGLKIEPRLHVVTL